MLLSGGRFSLRFLEIVGGVVIACLVDVSIVIVYPVWMAFVIEIILVVGGALVNAWLSLLHLGSDTPAHKRRAHDAV